VSAIRPKRRGGLGWLTSLFDNLASPLNKGGAFYHSSVKAAIDRDGDTLTVLRVLAKQVGVRGIFSDWPATTTFYANCMGMK
jgi:glycerophosphoryl diester phosphodiesterase